MSEKLTPAEILAHPKNTICSCSQNDCTWHGNCRDCVALHRYHSTIPECFDLPKHLEIILQNGDS